MSGANLIQRGLSPLRQNPWLALMGIIAVAVSLAFIAIFALIGSNMQSAVKAWSRDFQIIIFLNSPAGESTVRQWQTALGSMAEIEEVSYTSSTEALQQFRLRLGNDANLLQGLGADVLPASFILKLHPEFRNHHAVKQLVDRLAQKEEWRDLHYGTEWIERFDAVQRLMRMGGIIFGLFSMVSAFLLVANTIRLILYARRNEVELLLLLGATPLYIALPFLVEGAVFGGIGALIALALVALLYQIGLQQGLISLLQMLDVDHVTFLPPYWQAALIFAGIALGLTASLVAMRKLSKV